MTTSKPRAASATQGSEGAEPQGKSPPRTLFVVCDTAGAGRIVGVFSERSAATAVAEVNLAYYRLIEVVLDTVRNDAFSWLGTDEARSELQRVIRSQGLRIQHTE